MSQSGQKCPLGSVPNWTISLKVICLFRFLRCKNKFPLLNKTGYKKVFLLNAAILAVRYVLYAFSPNIYVFLAASLVHCLGTAVHTVGNLGYLRNSIPANSYGTAVTLYNAVVSVGRAVYGLIFGYVMDWFGTTAIFFIAAIIMAGGTFIISKTHLFDDVDHMIKMKKAN